MNKIFDSTRVFVIIRPSLTGKVMPNRKVFSEKNISALQKKKKEQARLFSENSFPRRKKIIAPKKAQGAQTLDPCLVSMKHGFKKANRIRKREEFKTLFGKANAVKGKYLSLRLWLCDEESGEQKPKLATTVSRQTSKLATQRNLWRRRIREVFRNQQHGIKPNAWIWIRVTSEEKAPAYSVIEEEIIGLIKKTHGNIH